MSLGLNLGLMRRTGGVLRPVLDGDALQWVVGYESDGDYTDKLAATVGVASPDATSVNVLDFTGVTGGGLDFAQIEVGETVVDFEGTGTQPVVNASGGRIDCIGTGELHSITLSGGFRFVASAGTSDKCYSPNGLDLFAGKEMLEDLEMIDYLEVA